MASPSGVKLAHALVIDRQNLDDLAFGGQALVVGIDVDAGANGGHAHPAVNAVERRGVHFREVLRRLAEVLVLALFAHFVVAVHGLHERVDAPEFIAHSSTRSRFGRCWLSSMSWLTRFWTSAASLVERSMPEPELPWETAMLCF